MAAPTSLRPISGYRPTPRTGESASVRSRRLATALLDAPQAVVYLDDARAGARGPRLATASSAGDVLAREVLRRGAPFMLRSPDEAPRPMAAALRAAGWTAYVGVPLRTPDGRLAGVLGVADVCPREWTAAEVALLTDLAAVSAERCLGESRQRDGWVAALAQREAQEARRKSEERLALIFNSTSDLTFLVAVEGDDCYRCVAVNESFLALSGLAERQVVGHRVESFLPPRTAADVKARYAEALRNGAPLRYEAPIELPLGTIVIEATLTPVHDETGTYLLGVARDVTQHRQAEAELRAAKESAEQARSAAEDANQAKTDFLSRMSHELRTPLNSVIGFANVLRSNKGGRLDARELSYLDRVITNGRHLLSIISDMLDISRIEAGKMPLTLSPVPLAPLVRTTLAGFEAQAQGRPVSLRAELPPVLARLETDATRLQQVLINLVGNALKFTERGTVTVRVEADPATGVPLRICVADTGIGIAPERQEAIFHAFEQAESGTTRAFGGTGLGLAISRSLCQLMGYGLTVESRPGHGATFTIELPRPA